MPQHLDRVLTVSQFNTMIKGALERNTFIIEGEVTGFTVSKGKFVFFDLKDSEARVGCFMMLFKMGMPLEDGVSIKAIVKPSMHVASGRFSVTIEQYELVGEGALKKAYEETKRKLQAEGLFDEGRKRVLPRIPKRIAVVTSAEAAAYTDFLRIVENRWKGLEINLAPVSVQGVMATGEICNALRWLNENMELDAIVLTRGGGSLEELQAFNNEEVCRVVYASKIPVISAVGHERDVVLTDFVADVRASTPSNAAERLVPRMEDIEGEIIYYVEKMESYLKHQTQKILYAVEDLLDRLSIVVDTKLVRVDEMTRLLAAFDPRKVLQRGFAIVSDEKGVVKDAKSVKKGDALKVLLAKGELEVEKK